jgi:hypothetical protein
VSVADVELPASPVANANDVAAASVADVEVPADESVLDPSAAACVVADDVAAPEVWPSRLRSAVLPDPTPTAGADPTTVPVAVLLPPKKPVAALEDSVTMLGSAAVEDAASCTVSDADDGAGAVPAWRRCGVNSIGLKDSLTT